MDTSLGFSVIMPTYNQSHFIRRALMSLFSQACQRWELIIVDDGSTDGTCDIISDIIAHENVTYIHNEKNEGLGYALNQGLDAAKYELIAYLPSDDYFDPEHLESMLNIYVANKNAALVFTGIRYDMRDTLGGAPDTEATGCRCGFGLQLVQVSHRACEERWVERDTWISDDLTAMYWHKLISKGLFVPTNRKTCFWTQHPWQRHKLINEKYGGGINKVRSYYHITTPIKIKVSKEKFVDEEKAYRVYQSQCIKCTKPLKILIVGELAYNPERIVAFEEAGHKLYGLWMPRPNLAFSTVGPLPFGHIEDIPLENWREKVRQINPDIIYGLLNWGAIGWCYEIAKAFPDIPFVWHYKEGPYLAMKIGNFGELIYLYRHASVRIYLNDVVRQWFEMFVSPGAMTMMMDGDLPKRNYFTDDFSPKLSATDGEPHTVVAGRMIGINQSGIDTLAKEGIHIHLYIENYHSSRAALYEQYRRKHPRYFHIHSHCSPNRWVSEFSRYDAGWLHCIESYNNGNLMRATWDDLNYPARMSTYAAAGLPIIQRKNEGCIVAVEQCLKEKNMGVLFTDFGHLACLLKDKEFMNDKQTSVMVHRDEFCFDHYVPHMVDLFRKAISERGKNNG